MTKPVVAKARVRLMNQDRALGRRADKLTAARDLVLPDATRDRFLDGPATRRLATVDLDPATGRPVESPVRFVPRETSPTSGTYDAPADDVTDPAFVAVNAFGIAFDTIRMFEEPGALGRPVRWSFGREQLLVIPRAGEWANAVYDRRTGSLQFFSFEGPNGTVHTALSRDIVAHECGHALVDAVAPFLLEGMTPQSLAIHEAVADLIALLMALKVPAVREAELIEDHGLLTRGNAFATIATEFGEAKAEPGIDEARRELRNLSNDASVAALAGADVHTQSLILSGIFYDTFEAITASVRAGAEANGKAPLAAAGMALGSAFPIMRRLLLRGIDYLPPGDLTFADFGRATLAADRSAQSDEHRAGVTAAREAFALRFVARGIVPDVAALETPVPDDLGVTPDALTGLLNSDWLAYRFVDQNRPALQIPADIAITVLPRIDATKETGELDPSGSGRRRRRELILKVAWSFEEKGPLGLTVLDRRVRAGCTLALDWDTGRPLALLRTDPDTEPAKAGRDAMVRRLLDEGASTDPPPVDGPAPGAVHLWAEDGRLRAAGVASRLHVDAVAGLEAPPPAVAPTGRRRRAAVTAPPVPPVGVEPGAFFDLMAERDRRPSGGVAGLGGAAPRRRRPPET